MKSMKHGLWAFVVGLVSAYAVILLGNVVGTMTYMRAFDDRQSAMQAAAANSWLQMGLYAGMELMLLLVTFVFVRGVEKKRNFLSEIGLRPQKGSLKMFGLSLLLVLGVKVVAWTILFMTHAAQWQSTGFAAFHPAEVIGYLGLMLVNGLLPGIFEEIFFRGYVQERLIQSKGPVIGVVVTSVLFALMHVGRYTSLLTLLYVTILGLFLGCLYVRTRSLYVPIGFHFMWDFTNNWIGGQDHPSLFLIHSFDHLAENTVTWIFILLVVVLLLTVLIWEEQVFTLRKHSIKSIGNRKIKLYRLAKSRRIL